MRVVHLICIGMIFLSCTPQVWAEGTKPNALESTLDDQQSVEVTVYNQNMGLVKDTRLIKLPQGQEKEMRFMDVANSTGKFGLANINRV